MGLFCVLSVPLWFLLVVSFYRTPSRGWRGLLLPFLGGLVVGMAALTFSLGLLTRSPFEMKLSGLFLWAWVRGPGLAGLIVSAATTAVFFRKPTSYSRIRELSAWFAGTAFLFLLWHAFVPEPGFDGYRVLLSPFVWIGAVGSAVWLGDRGLRMDGWGRYVLLVCAAGFTTLFTFVPAAYAAGERLVAWIIAVVFAAGATFLAFLDSRGRLS